MLCNILHIVAKLQDNFGVKFWPFIGANDGAEYTWQIERIERSSYI